MKITNKTNVTMPLLIGVLADTYDYVDDPDYLSTTTLIRPLKQIILSSRVEQSEDVADKVNTFIGSAVHSVFEDVWFDEKARQKVMEYLGYKQDIIDAVEINPETPTDGMIAVYVEPPRRRKDVMGISIGGKPDLIMDGRLHDYKTSSTFKWTKGDFQDYLLQLSIYRWLYQDLIDQDTAGVCFIFKDWKAAQAEANPDYPDSPFKEMDLPLMSIEDTEQYITGKVNEYRKYRNKPEAEMPECSEEELWMDPPKYKYYSNPAKTEGRSTKNFTTPADAQKHLNEKGKGVIITEYGQPKRCLYCPAFDICQQRRKYYPED